MASPPHQLRSETLSAQMVEQALDGQRRRVRGIESWVVVLRALAILLLIPFAVVLLDHNLSNGLPDPIISTSGMLWIGLLLVGLIALRIWQVRRRPRRLYLARDLEQTYGIRHNLLVNTVQIGETNEAGYAENVARQQTAAALQQAELVRPSGPLLRRAAIPLLLVLSVWVLYATFGPKSIWPSLARFFGLGGQAPTATQLEWIRPASDEDLYLDRPLEIVVATSGREVEQVRLQRFASDSFEGEPPFACQLQRGLGEGSPILWRVKLAPHELTETFHYRIQAGDAELRGTLHLQQPVQVSKWEVELTPPAYLNLPVRVASGTEIVAWNGTQATFHLHANAPIRDPIFAFKTEQGDNRTRMQLDPSDPAHATYSQQLTDSGTFRAVFRDVLGRSALPAPPGRLTVRVDQPPVVEITRPSADEAATRVDVTLTPRVELELRDDVALEQVYFVVERDGRMARNNLEIKELSQSLSMVTPLDASMLEPGEEVRVWFEASDGRVLPDGTPAPQVGRSRILTLTRSIPLEPQVGEGQGAGPGDGDGDGMGEGQGNGGGEEAGASGGGGTPANGNGDGAGQGGAGQGAGTGDEPGSGQQPGEAGPGEAPGGEPGGQGTPQQGDGTLEGDGRPDVEGPGGMTAEGGDGDYDEELRRFAEEFGPQAESVQDEREQTDSPENEAEDDASTSDNSDPSETQPPNETEGDPEMPEDEPPSSDPADPPEPQASEDEAPSAETPDAEPAEAPSDAADAQPENAEGEQGESEPGTNPENEGEEGSEPELQQPEVEDEAEQLQAIEELLAEAEAPSEEELARAGLSASQAQAFLGAFERLQALRSVALVQGEVTQVEGGALPEGALGEAARSAETDLRVAPGGPLEDRIGQIVAPGDERPPPELQALLDAYYRAMAELDPERVADD